MKFRVNLRQLERRELVLEGEAEAEDLDLGDVHDELWRLAVPVRYELTVSRLQQSILVHGKVEVDLSCECSRCLNPFGFELRLDPWDALIELEGEDKVEVQDDSVDLTPYLREDIVLALPQHPLCKPECRGLPVASKKSTDSAGYEHDDGHGTKASAWDALDQLKLK
jgi:uncharacterized protein